MAVVIWSGDPEVCDICKAPILDTGFVDGRTRFGPWALMCHNCHEVHGVGLGTGKGQDYMPDGKGNFVKIEG